MTFENPRSILVIRRDNIGDLLCTTPLLRAIRESLPATRISILVNSYNAPVLWGSCDVDDVLVYEKAKHRDKSRSIARWLFGRMALFYRLRRQNFDFVILATPNLSEAALKFARYTRAGKIVGYGLPDGDPRLISISESKRRGHECEIVFGLLEALGIGGTPPAMRLLAQSRLVPQLGGERHTTEICLGVHISARKPQQRWAVESFAELVRNLLLSGRVARVLVFWAPGREDDPLHPGDDGKAQILREMLSPLAVEFVPSKSLDELIAGLALCDQVFCADGGAMHVAAALGKPIVCLFGNSDAERWYPWGVPFELLQKPSRTVADISVDEVVLAWDRLEAKLPERGAK